MKNIIIVDGYSTGRFLAPALLERGYSCVHVQSGPLIPEMCTSSFLPKNFIANIIFNGNIDQILEALKSYKAQFVLPGSEGGVELADLLAERLDLVHNDVRFSTARRDKFKMIEVVSKANIDTASYLRSNSIEEILQWVDEHEINPVVLKPLKSSGADHVFICHTKEDVQQKFHNIINKNDLYHTNNEYVLAQSFLQGTEYVVNTTSSHGKHYIAEIWRCHKEKISNAGYISLLEELIPYESQEANQAIATYAKNILDALKIEHGPGHFEIMLTEIGPILIEVAARLQGCVDPEIIEKATNGNSNLSLMLDSYLDPTKIQALSTSPYKLASYVFRIFIKSNVAGTLEETPDLSPIRNLPSFGSVMKFCISAGDEITLTHDLYSSLGVIHLIHSDYEQLQKDYEFYKKYETEELFKITPKLTLRK